MRLAPAIDLSQPVPVVQLGQRRGQCLDHQSHIAYYRHRRGNSLPDFSGIDVHV